LGTQYLLIIDLCFPYRFAYNGLVKRYMKDAVNDYQKLKACGPLLTTENGTLLTDVDSFFQIGVQFRGYQFKSRSKLTFKQFTAFCSMNARNGMLKLGMWPHDPGQLSATHEFHLVGGRSAARTPTTAVRAFDAGADASILSDLLGANRQTPSGLLASLQKGQTLSDPFATTETDSQIPFSRQNPKTAPLLSELVALCLADGHQK
jgi:hypothetical protein